MNASGEVNHGSSGFALPAAILAMVVVGVLITGGIHVATQESRIGLASERATRAFYVAESGLHTALSTWNPANSELAIWGASAEQSGTSDQGNWVADIQRVDELLYLIQSTGTVAGTGGAQASRSLAVMARHTSVPLEPPAALQTIGNVQISGSAKIHGEDQVPGSWAGATDPSTGDLFCPGALQDMPGVITDEASEVTTSGANAEYTGSPPHVQDPDLTMDSFQQFGDMEWAELTSLADIRLAGGGLNSPAPNPSTPTGVCNVTDPYNWGDPINPTYICGNHFPVVHIQGDASIQAGGVGQGILLVDGDLDLRGNFQYYGIIIVQGAFNVQGGGANGPRISGGVMAANANIDLTQSIVGSSIVQNSRCAVNRAIANNDALNRLRVLDDRGWVDLTGVSF